MLRNYLLFILILGFGASMLTTGGMRSVPDDDNGRSKTITVPSEASAPAAELQQVGGEGLILQREWDGHFYANAEINGARVRMLVDTGASGIALTRDDARKAGIGISIGMPNIVGQGAGGAVKGEYVTLDRIRLGSESATSVPAVVLDGGGQSLLGQSFLQQFASVEIKGDRMVLR